MRTTNESRIILELQSFQPCPLLPDCLFALLFIASFYVFYGISLLKELYEEARELQKERFAFPAFCATVCAVLL